MEDIVSTECQQQSDDELLIGGCLVLTKQEVQAASDLRTLINSKADGMRVSFLTSVIEGINKKGWAVVEYRKNTTGL